MAILAPNPIPSSHSPLLLHRPSSSHRPFLLVKSNSSSVVVTEQGDSPSLPSKPTDDPQFRGCKACGGEEIEKGCNGEGRIQGGIATVPGFGWWPIKAFRPCPGFVACGGRYKRRGQSMDEVTSGRGRDVSVENTDKAKSSKKSEGPGRLKG